ncbi:MAG: transglycosylase SLT domain-containing protein [Oricola sp.]
MTKLTAIGTIVLLSLAATGCQTTASNSAEPLGYASTRTARSAEKPYDNIVSKYAGEYGVPVELAHAVIFTESRYRADARGSAGEIGLMQLKLATARGVGYRGSAKGLYDPATNIEYGMKYLGGAYKLAGGTTCGTILRYNAGHGAKRMNPVSQAYCNKVAKLLN